MARFDQGFQIKRFQLFVQEYPAEKAMQVLKQLLPYLVAVRREGGLTRIKAEEVVPDDGVILFSPTVYGLAWLANPLIFTADSLRKYLEKNRQRG